MTRDEVYRDIESTIGFVPSWFKEMSDQYLEQEWNGWKLANLQEGVIPPKYKELICLGILSAIQDKYGIVFRTETAKAAGVTDEEIREVGELVKYEVGWGPFLRLNQVDFEQYKEEVARAVQSIKERREERVRTSM